MVFTVQYGNSTNLWMNKLIEKKNSYKIIHEFELQYSQQEELQILYKRLKVIIVSRLILKLDIHINERERKREKRLEHFKYLHKCITIPTYSDISRTFSL